MVKSNINALGIIFPNYYDSLVPELVNERLMGSIPFASRYRLIDFVLSSMVNSGINSVSVLVREKYHSLMDHPLDYLRKQKEKYVIMADTNVAVNFDFRKLVAWKVSGMSGIPGVPEYQAIL